MTEENSLEPLTGRSRLQKHVDASVMRLQAAYLADRAWAVSSLARLRNGLGKQPGEDMQLVALTTANLYSDEIQLPDKPTELEQAAFAAITLFALHQQSKRSKGMHQRGVSLGEAAHRLPQRAQSEGVQRRMNALVSATSWESTVTHARGLIQMLRAADIPLDYAQFAQDLLTLHDPDRAHWVRNRWGRDFYLSPGLLEDSEDTSPEPGAASIAGSREAATSAS